MKRPPDHAPLGAKPVLPPPAPSAASARAAVIFRRMMTEQAARAAVVPEDESSEAPPARPPPRGPSPRRYGLALAVAYGDAPSREVAPGAEAPAAAPAQDEPTLPGASLAAAELPCDDEPELIDPGEPLPPEVTREAPALPARPPPGAPTVRPSARRAVVVPAGLDDTLEHTVDGLMLVNEPDGATAFDIAIRDDIFSELACRVTLRDGALVATFRVHDPNLRRLLEAEAGRLSARLAERGFKVAAVQVIEE